MKSKTTGTSEGRSTYQVHAEIHTTGDHPEDFDDAKAGHPLERRLNRIERIATTYRGRVDLRFDNGVLITFDTADAAVLSSCEMQKRCIVLPQLSQMKLTLRIGIHRGIARQRAKDEGDHAREIALELAAADDGIIISDSIFEDLKPELRSIATPLDERFFEIKAFQINWRREIPSSVFGGESFWPSSLSPHPAGPFVRLHQGIRTVDASQDRPIITLGREPSCDLVLEDAFASRVHCRVERRADSIVLTDSSTNGTCVRSDDGTEYLVKKKSMVLSGKGLLFFGRAFDGERRGGVRYETY